MDLRAFAQISDAKAILQDIKASSSKAMRFMEFCGGHTMAIHKDGLLQLLPKNITLLSGPGCPVCVTSSGDLDVAISLARQKDVIITSFGDLLRVPSSKGTLIDARADGADVRIVYSTLAALEIARNNPSKKVVFLGIGFETTAPTIAASIKQAALENLSNYLVLSLCKLTPPVMRAILSSGEIKIDGIIAPGHVSAIIGSQAWQFVADEYHLPVVISGFDTTDILYCLQKLVQQVEKNENKLESAYARSVSLHGNKVALNIMDEVFEISYANWRGIGLLLNSGLAIKKEYSAFDAMHVLQLQNNYDNNETPGCICGDIIRGAKTPKDCQLFIKGICTPNDAKGPCMVSSEGSCAAYYNFRSK